MSVFRSALPPLPSPFLPPFTPLTVGCRLQALRALDSLLGARQYLLGAGLALVDGVVWSALRCSALQVSPNVAAWRARVATAAGLGQWGR